MLEAGPCTIRTIDGALGRAAIAPKPIAPDSRRLALRILSPSLLISSPENSYPLTQDIMPCLLPSDKDDDRVSG